MKKKGLGKQLVITPYIHVICNKCFRPYSNITFLIFAMDQE